MAALFAVGLVPTAQALAATGNCPQQTLTISNSSASPPSPLFGWAAGAAADDSGNIYVADNTGTVYRFDSAGNQTLSINNSSANPPSPPFGDPNGLGSVAVDLSGNIYVSDIGNGIYRFDSSGNQTLAINNASVPPPSPYFTSDGVGSESVAVDPQGNIYVTDRNSGSNGTVYRFDPTGNQTLAITGVNLSPEAVAADADGNIFVTGSNGVTRFDPSGNPTLVINNSSANPPSPQFDAPYGVAVDSLGNIHVSAYFSGGTGTVYRFDSSGNQTLAINNTSLPAPTPLFQNGLGGVDADSSGNIYVTDGRSGAVYRFSTECDGDGVSDSIEDDGPNAGDANNDGTDDSVQDNVVSLPAAVVGGPYVTVVGPGGTSLDDISTINPASLPSLPPGVLSFPSGLVGFTVNGLDEGATIEVEVIFHGGVGGATRYYKFQNGVWVDFTDHAAFSGNTVTLTLTDGGPGDADGEANGQIVDPGGPAVLTVVGPPPPPPLPPVGSVCRGRAVTVDLTRGQTPTNGPDVIRGTTGDDIINALGGDDIICGLGGDDIISGNQGNDRAFGGGGDDEMRGNAGNDILRGRAGDDLLYGQAGSDLLDGGTGTDTCRGGTGVDSAAACETVVGVP